MIHELAAGLGPDALRGLFLGIAAGNGCVVHLGPFAAAIGVLDAEGTSSREMVEKISAATVPRAFTRLSISCFGLCRFERSRLGCDIRFWQRSARAVELGPEWQLEPKWLRHRYAAFFV